MRDNKLILLFFITYPHCALIVALPGGLFLSNFVNLLRLSLHFSLIVSKLVDVGESVISTLFFRAHHLYHTTCLFLSARVDLKKITRFCTWWLEFPLLLCCTRQEVIAFCFATSAMITFIASSREKEEISFEIQLCGVHIMESPWCLRKYAWLSYDVATLWHGHVMT